MAYTHQADLAARGQDRQFSIVTTANLAGAAVLGLAAWQLTKLLGLTGDVLSAGWWLQTGLILAASGTGVLMTIRWSGLSLLDRLLLWASYQQRRLARQHHIAPQAAVTTSRDQPLTTLTRDGTVLLRPYRPEEHLE
jgi:hypothetical protein